MRLKQWPESFSIQGFNPRICKRCDRRYTIISYKSCVSIHASVKDATSNCLPSIPVCKRFNPRICKRCDPSPLDKSSIAASFNPRICKRCDLRRQQICSHCLSFNPRICKRCDTMSLRQLILILVSIHASVKDATLINTNRLVCNRFQSTHL